MSPYAKTIRNSQWFFMRKREIGADLLTGVEAVDVEVVVHDDRIEDRTGNFVSGEVLAEVLWAASKGSDETGMVR